MISDRATLVAILLTGMAALVGIAVALLMRQATEQVLNARVSTHDAPQAAEAAGRRAGLFGGLGRLFGRVGSTVSRGTNMYSSDDIAQLEGVLAAAGFKSRQLVPMVLGAKVAFFALVVTAAVLFGVVQDLSPIQKILAIAISFVPALMIPEVGLRMLRRPYERAIRRGVADALDLLVVCTQAGMGLESALAQVTREIRFSNPAIAQALTGLIDELKILPDRREAFQNFGRRSGVEGIRRMSTVLGQALQYGTPLSQALNAMAIELRREQMTRLEARAVRLPALLVFPLVVFILPSLFIVLMGPTLMTLFDTLRSAAGAFPQ